MDVTGCPRAQVRDVAWALEAWDWHRRGGGWPIAGGWMQQTALCVEAVEMVERETRVWKPRQTDE